MVAAIAKIDFAHAIILRVMVMATSLWRAGDVDIEDQRVLPNEVEVEDDVDEVPSRPRIEADIDVDPRPDDVAGQHDHSDAVNELQLSDVLGLAQQHRDLLARSYLGVAADGELRGLDEDPLFAVVKRVGGHVGEGRVRRHRRPTGPLRRRAPDDPAGAECGPGIPGPAELLIPEPA